LGKVVSQDELILQRQEWKRNGKRFVFASGRFDLLHPGHTRLLEQARGMGDVLVVAIQSDDSVRASSRAKQKQDRPITPAAERAEILASLAAVDCVVEFDGATPQEFLSRLVPDVIVEGGQVRKAASPANRSENKPAAPHVVHIPLEPGYSTSQLIERIRQHRA
jgi:rfaE bifunctional protein nucleotidyltransferase chain/domain